MKLRNYLEINANKPVQTINQGGRFIRKKADSSRTKNTTSGSFVMLKKTRSPVYKGSKNDNKSQFHSPECTP